MKSMKQRPWGIGISALILFVLASGAQAGPITCAVGGTINAGGPGFGTLTETIDQSGLDVGYTCGVTDFDTYIASGPVHTDIFAGFEWFSNQGSNSASVTYDLGSVQGIDAMALWNEESSGIGLLDLWGSVNGTDFFSLAAGLLPTDNSLGGYLADVFDFGAVALQYIRLDMSDCPQVIDTSFTACSIGEVAFRSAAVPEPGTLALLGIGLFGLGLARRRKA